MYPNKLLKSFILNLPLSLVIISLGCRSSGLPNTSYIPSDVPENTGNSEIP